MLNQKQPKQPKVPKNHQELPPLQVPGLGVPELGSKVKSFLLLNIAPAPPLPVLEGAAAPDDFLGLLTAFGLAPPPKGINNIINTSITHFFLTFSSDF